MLNRLRNFLVNVVSGVLADAIERLKPETRKKIFLNFLMNDLWLMDGSPLDDSEKLWMASRISDLFDATIGIRKFMQEAGERLNRQKTESC